MCGLVGIRRFDDLPVRRCDIAEMRDRILHRGPDDTGIRVVDGLGLGHARLAILDPTPHAAQPMTSRCGRFTIAYNGEIYNFKDLRRRLEARGGSLDSTGDTEVLLESIAAVGLDAIVTDLEGFFAFALWDDHRRTLTLVRDRHGIKPLYFTHSGNELRFASEVKPLVQRDPAVDYVTLSAMLLGQGCTWGQDTLFRGINRVAAGELITFDADGTRTSRDFFTPPDFVDPTRRETLAGYSDDQIVDEVEAALVESVRLRLQSDAPVACLASGGVDSALIAAIAARHFRPLDLYHADVVHDSEREAAEALASHLGLRLHVETVQDVDFVDHISAATWHNDAPISYHPNSIPFSLVNRRAAADGIKVVLSGEGSDEYFLGYPRLALQPWIDRYRGGLDAAQRLLHSIVPRAGAILWPNRSGGRGEMLQRLVRRRRAGAEERIDEVVAHIQDTRQRRETATTLDLLQRHLTTLLHRNDRLAMAWGIESRFPFLGHRLASIALNLPHRARIRGSWNALDPRHPFIVDKWCVRRVARRYLPESIRRRPKKCFPVSIARRLRVDSGFFDGGFIADFYGLPRSALRELAPTRPTEWSTQLLYVEVWAQLFVMGRRREEVQSNIHRHVSTAHERPKIDRTRVTGHRASAVGRRRIA